MKKPQMLMHYLGVMNLPGDHWLEVYVPVEIMAQVQELPFKKLPPEIAAFFHESASKEGFDLPDDYSWIFQEPAESAHLSVMLHGPGYEKVATLAFIDYAEP